MHARDQKMITSLRRSYEAFNREDFDGAIKLAHPEIEFVRPGGQTPVRGANAMRAWMEPDAFEKQTIDPLEFSVEGSKVLVRQHARALGAGSGIEVDIQSWSVWTFNDQGLATRVEFYLAHQEAEARKAAGLHG
jgi:ketosteroid isomerase-like protein